MGNNAEPQYAKAMRLDHPARQGFLHWKELRGVLPEPEFIRPAAIPPEPESPPAFQLGKPATLLAVEAATPTALVLAPKVTEPHALALLVDTVVPTPQPLTRPKRPRHGSRFWVPPKVE
jgi:hypothetical protein